MHSAQCTCSPERQAEHKGSYKVYDYLCQEFAAQDRCCGSRNTGNGVSLRLTMNQNILHKPCACDSGLHLESVMTLIFPAVH